MCEAAQPENFQQNNCIAQAVYLQLHTKQVELSFNHKKFINISWCRRHYHCVSQRKEKKV